ncbi:hypothetical protein BJP25_17105 [Actinokineospora bangkokensis]|uniref:Uncharacterized protein n=1 Tax=Actinokineospora bangkokensis TaxID=1193682 RepID=A0A1Q9LMG5_9PSEU|nr:hypothetical protein BJP25_17105 [Actinokineospora bangkokensis]
MVLAAALGAATGVLDLPVIWAYAVMGVIIVVGVGVGLRKGWYKPQEQVSLRLTQAFRHPRDPGRMSIAIVGALAFLSLTAHVVLRLFGMSVFWLSAAGILLFLVFLVAYFGEVRRVSKAARAREGTNPTAPE